MIDKREYEIRISDVLEEKWKSYFSPLDLAVGKNETILSGEIHDQAELFGILLRIRDLGLHLTSFRSHQANISDGFCGMMSCIMIM
jgi:hypothetical protein